MTAIVDIPEIDWTWPPETLNRVLQILLRRVKLGPDMRPVWADWTVA